MSVGGSSIESLDFFSNGGGTITGGNFDDQLNVSNAEMGRATTPDPKRR